MEVDKDVLDIENDGMEEAKGMDRWESGDSDRGHLREPLLVHRRNTTSQLAIVGANVCPVESLDYEYLLAFFAYSGCNLVLAAFAAIICAYIAPAAAGSGIPEVKSYLNGVDAPSILAPSTLFVKSTRNSLLTKITPYFRWRSALLWRTFFTTAVVAVVLRALIDYCRSGNCGLFGKGGLIMFDMDTAEVTYRMADLVPIIILGIIGGILGSLYNRFLDRILRVYSIINELVLNIFLLASLDFLASIFLRLWKGPRYKILLTCIISIITSCCSYGLPWIATCTPCPSNVKEECPTIGRSGNFKNFQCPAGQYNDLASLFLNTNDDAIRNLFSTGTDTEYSISTIILFFSAIYGLGLITYGVAVPCGLFIPVILAGASYGRLVGTLIGGITDLDPGFFALLGAASFLGGTMRMTVSVCVILLELTNNLLMLPLVMLVLLISKTVADAFNHGVYDQIVRMKGLPYLEAHAEPYMKHLAAGDVVSAPLITFSGVERVSEVVHALRFSGHNAFPVVNEPPFSEAPELCGLVLRSHLLVLLKARLFKRDRVVSRNEISRKIGAFGFAKPGSGKGLRIEDIDISDEEMEMYVDLHPVTNTSPYTVVETMSLAKAVVLFRQLGLRHLCVIPKTPARPPIVGILTRHDFMPEHILGLYPHLKHSK
ncbi:Chloride channel protein [Nymphaea thermarum]|nr:Chloride channel protein [Nymphaea thermarum]